MGLLMKRYVLFIFKTQINISCMEYIIIVTLIFSELLPLYVPKNLENAPAQVLSVLGMFLTFSVINTIMN